MAQGYVREHEMAEELPIIINNYGTMPLLDRINMRWTLYGKSSTDM